MRVLPILVIAAMVAAPCRTAAGGGEADDQETISAKDLRVYFEPYIPGVKDCYAPSAPPAGSPAVLRLELTIHRDGSVVRFGFQAPGVTGPLLRRLDACLRKLSIAWHFPVRRSFTTAIIPLQFTRTQSPGAGPKASMP